MRRRVVMGALAVVVLVFAGCGGGEADSTQPAAQPVTVETGGMALPGIAAPGAMTATAGAAGSQEAMTESIETAVEVPVLPVGASVAASGPTAVYAEPEMQALRFAQYAAGSRFTVVEPDGEHTAYPVVVDGARWYRVRAEDGLVGWVNDLSLAGGS